MAAPVSAPVPAAAGEGFDTAMGVRFNTLRTSPAGATYKLAVVQFKVPGAKNGGSDKGPDGNRIDSIPIANGVIEAGAAYSSCRAPPTSRSMSRLVKACAPSRTHETRKLFFPPSSVGTGPPSVSGATRSDS